MKQFAKNAEEMLRQYKVLRLLVVLQLAALAVLAVRLVLPLTNVTCQAQQLQPLVDTIQDTVDENGLRGFAAGQQTAFASQKKTDERGLPWLQSEEMTLHSGLYRCTVIFASDNAATPDYAGVVSLYTPDAASVASDVELAGTQGEATGQIWLNGLSRKASFAVYAKNTSLAVGTIQLQEVWHWRLVQLLQWLLLFAMADGLVLALLPGGPFGLEKKQRLVLAALAGTVLLASLPALAGSVSNGIDLSFHLSRISGIAHGLQAGEFPVRIYPDSLYGYGYASPVFYGDALLYIPAILHLVGYPLYAAYNFYILMLNLLTAATSYLCFHKMLHSRMPALMGAILYTTAAYRLFNLYYRPALGESSAQTFLPLIVYGFWCLLSDTATERQHDKAWLPLMLGFSGVIETHIISTEIVAIFSVLLCLAGVVRIFRWKHLRILLKGAAATVLVNLWFLVPFFSYMQGQYRCTSDSVVYDMDVHSLALTQMFLLWSENMDVIRLGGALVLGVVALLLTYILWPKTDDKQLQGTQRLATVALCGAVAAVLLSSTLVQWRGIEGLLGTKIAHYLCAIQFPFRYLIVATILLVVVAMCGVVILRFHKGQKAAALLASGLMAIALFSGWMDIQAYVLGSYGKQAVATAAQLPDARDISGLEYLPLAFDADYTNTELQPNEGVSITDFHRTGVGYAITATNTNAQPASIELPLTYYPGYRVTKNASNGGELALQMTKHGVVAVTLSAGYDGSFTVAFREPNLWRLAELISAGSIVAMLFWNCFMKKRKRGKTAA